MKGSHRKEKELLGRGTGMPGGAGGDRCGRWRRSLGQAGGLRDSGSLHQALWWQSGLLCISVVNTSQGTNKPGASLCRAGEQESLHLGRKHMESNTLGPEDVERLRLKHVRKGLEEGLTNGY